MQGLWVRIDANLAGNHKVLALLEKKGGDHALNVYVFALGYCMNAGTDGFIPKVALGLFHGRPRDSVLLAEVGLWHELPGGWQVHGWADYQPSSEEAQRRSEKAKRAAAKRWGHVEQATEDMLRAVPQALPRAVPGAIPSNAEQNRTEQNTNERRPRPDLEAHVSRRTRGNQR